MSFFRRVMLLAISMAMAASMIGGTMPALSQDDQTEETPAPTLLTDPFLQLPTKDAVHVVWFTEFEGQSHTLTYGENLDQTVEATTTKMSRLAEDEGSRVGEQRENGQVYKSWTPRNVWRHEAIATGLKAGVRVPYFVTSVREDGMEVSSAQFTLQPLPTPGQPLKILLTSDNQLMPNTPANMQKIVEVIGEGTIDAVFLAGDLENIPDRASEWFDDNRGRAFFPALQGRSDTVVEKTFEEGDSKTTISTRFFGGPIIQYAPLFPAIGNHEVMGRFNRGTSTSAQFNDPQPRAVAQARYERMAELVNPNNDPTVREQWIVDNSWNTITYRELFTLPDDSPGGEDYYAIQYGDVYLISLFSTRIWRSPSLSATTTGKYREAEQYLDNPDMWGYGDFIFEDLAEGSPQHTWLKEQLESEAFKNARIRIVMLHQGPHGVGDNYNPVMAHPVQIIDRDEQGRIIGVRYEYPIEDDILMRDVMPMLEEANVHLMLQGHSHLWFRMETEGGIDILETSNVGNNYGCYLPGGSERGNTPLADSRYDADNYAKVGDPHSLEPIMPSEFAPMSFPDGNPMPCIASNELSAFSILDTETGTVSSYVFDVRRPSEAPRLFDQFNLLDDAE